MNLLDAIKSGKEIIDPTHTFTFQWYQSGTGPYKELVSCDYFVMKEWDEMLKQFTNDMFTTSLCIDAYADSFLSDKWEVRVNASNT